MLKKYVFAGAAYSGKTTMLNEMAKLGFQTVPEAARQIIEEQLAKGGTLLPWINKRDFELACLDIILINETKFSEGIVFFDRALPDGVAYHRLNNNTPEYLEHAKNYRYDAVFLLDMLPGYNQDNVRKFDVGHEKIMQKLIGEAYAESTGKLIKVPAMSIEKRVELVLANIEVIR
ncbi:MAG: AAA family ATPase [Candidatus Nanoarchaeia archaeon]